MTVRQHKSSVVHVEPITPPKSKIFSVNLNNEITEDTNLSFQQKTSFFYGLLVFPTILIVTIANIDFAVIPKGLNIPLTEIELGIIFNAITMNAIQVASHYFDYLLIMGKDEANSGKNLIYQFILHGLGYNLVFFGLETLRENKFIELPTGPNGAIAANFAVFSVQFFIWMRQPKSKRSDVQFRKRFIWFILFRIVAIVLVTLYGQVTSLFDIVKSMFQLPLAFVLLAMRYVMAKCWNKMVERARGDNVSSAGFAVSSRVGCVHALFLMLVIGSKARWETTIIYALLDTALIVKLFINTMTNVEVNQIEGKSNLQGSLQSLVLKETLEILLPICFSMIKILAFYGPNKDVLPLVQNSTVEGLYTTFGKIGLFMLYDVTRIIIFATILKKRFGISLLRSYCELMKNYWTVIAGFATLTIFIVSIN